MSKTCKTVENLRDKVREKSTQVKRKQSKIEETNMSKTCKTVENLRDKVREKSTQVKRKQSKIEETPKQLKKVESSPENVQNSMTGHNIDRNRKKTQRSRKKGRII
ncbi:hypothetical protein QE152_g25460 [Popillia japonica]|uniref:Uncharacterized protein n=1 Tax=Popillia japonica TaxID=7064 RepID=A0AAW1K0D0_POPJA